MLAIPALCFHEICLSACYTLPTRISLIEIGNFMVKPYFTFFLGIALIDSFHPDGSLEIKIDNLPPYVLHRNYIRVSIENHKAHTTLLALTHNWNFLWEKVPQTLVWAEVLEAVDILWPSFKLFLFEDPYVIPLNVMRISPACLYLQ